MKIQHRLDTGGWDNIAPDRINGFIDAVLAMEDWVAKNMSRQPMKTRQEVLDLLSTGAIVHFAGEWYTQIRDGDAQKNPAPRVAAVMIRCSCGHMVAKNMVMMASLGSSCPDCYDRLSD